MKKPRTRGASREGFKGMFLTVNVFNHDGIAFFETMHAQGNRESTRINAN